MHFDPFWIMRIWRIMTSSEVVNGHLQPLGLYPPVHPEHGCHGMGAILVDETPLPM